MLSGDGDGHPVAAQDQDPSPDDSSGLRAVFSRPFVRVGVLGAVMTMLCLGTVILIATPPFVPADESAHAGYAMDVADGRFPRVEERVKVELPGQVPTRQWVAQHPPLYYALVGPILDWGDDTGHEFAGIRIARGFSVALGAVAVVLTAVLTAFFAGRRKTETMVLAAGLVACLPGFIGTSAAIHNDLLAVVTITVAYVGVVAAVVDRPRRWNIIAACAGGGLTMATRVNAVGLLALCCGALAFAGWYRTSGATRRRLLNGVVLGAAPVVTAAVTSGWWWLRNKRLYGDYLGTSYGQAVGGRPDNYTPFSWLTDRMTFPDLITRVEGGGPWEQIRGFGWYDRKIIGVIVVVIALGAVVGVVSCLRRWVANGRPLPDLGRVVAFGLVAGMAVLALLQLAYYVAAKTGSPNPRYMFPIVPIAAMAVAWACLQLPRRASVLVSAGILVFQVSLVLSTEGRYVNTRIKAPKVAPLRQLEDSFDAAGVPAPGFVLGLLIAGAFAGVALQTWAMWRASTRRDEPVVDAAVSEAVPSPVAV